MSRPKIIAFDFCGTLAELYPETNDVLCKFIRKTYQTELSNDNAAQAIDHVSKITPYYSSVKILEESQKLEYYVDFNSKVLKKLGYEPNKSYELYEFFCDQERHWKIKPMVPTLMNTLKKMGYDLIIASNFDEHLEKLLTRNKIINNFSNLYISAIIGLEKPSEDFYKFIINSLSCQPEDIVMVGDSLDLDIYPSTAIGMQGIFLNEKKFSEKIILQAPSIQYITISELTELTSVLS